jgi:hypothetical protein
MRDRRNGLYTSALKRIRALSAGTVIDARWLMTHCAMARKQAYNALTYARRRGAVVSAERGRYTSAAVA